MAIPKTEADIVASLGLHKHTIDNPTPTLGRAVIIELDGTNFTREAIRSALAETDESIIQDLLQYPDRISSHNNLSGHGSAGGDLEIETILLRADAEGKVRKIVFPEK